MAETGRVTDYFCSVILEDLDHQAHDDWARLRERYAKQLHRRDVERKEISWPHYDAMSFLEPFMQTKKK